VVRSKWQDLDQRAKMKIYRRILAEEFIIIDSDKDHSIRSA
jgi:Uma2 family endonuclease